MVLTEIALLKRQTNASLVSEDCWFAVRLFVAFEANQGVTFGEHLGEPVGFEPVLL